MEIQVESCECTAIGKQEDIIWNDSSRNHFSTGTQSNWVYSYLTLGPVYNSHDKESYYSNAV